MLLKSPRATSQTLQASVSMLNVKVHNSTIRKRLNKYGLFGRVAGELVLFSLKRTGSSKVTSDPRQTKVEMFGHNAQ